MVQKFHPDLVHDGEEKQRREEIMKQINKAYKEADLDKLKLIEQKQILEYEEEETNEVLEKLILSLRKALDRLNIEYNNLRKSEWYTWRESIKRAERQKRDLFAELEEKVLRDIAQKENILITLRRKHEKK